jgi:tetratricopeptide (TPR) repeat protein
MGKSQGARGRRRAGRSKGAHKGHARPQAHPSPDPESTRTDLGSNRAQVAVLGIVVFLVAIALRAAHIQGVAASPFHDVKIGDGSGYDAWARELAAGNWLGDEAFYQAPLYPYFLGFVYATLGDDPGTARGIQSLLGAFACTLVALATRRLFGIRAAWVAGLGLALYAPAIFFDGLFQKSCLDLFLFGLFLFLLAGWLAVPRARTGVGMGVTLGLLVLARENALIFFPAVLGWLLIDRRAAPKLRASTAGLFVLGLLVVLAPVAIRNRVLGGELHLTTSQFGPNFYYGNNPEADGTYRPLLAGRGDVRYEREDATRFAEQAVGRKLTPGEVSDYWTREAFKFIRTEPLRWLVLEARKLALSINATEVIDAEDISAYAEWSWPLRLLRHVLHFGILVPLAVLGLILTWRESPRPWPIALFAAVYLGSLLLFHVFARYRYPLVPFLAPFAAAGVMRIPDAIRQRRWPSLAAAGFAAVACNWHIMDEAPMHAVTYSNLGYFLADEGRREEALQWFRHSLEISPTSASAHLNLGATEFALGNLGAAETAYRRARELNPDLRDLHYSLGAVLEARGNLAEAEEVLHEGVVREPTSHETYYILARVRASLGNSDQAIADYERAIALKPEYAEAHINLGVLLVDLGRIEEAKSHYLDALRIAPDHSSAHLNYGLLLLVKGELEEAGPRLERAVQLDPNSALAHRGLGIAYAQAGRMDDAAKQFRAALAIEPEDAETLRLLEQVLNASE